MPWSRTWNSLGSRSHGSPSGGTRRRDTPLLGQRSPLFPVSPDVSHVFPSQLGLFPKQMQPRGAFTGTVQPHRTQMLSCILLSCLYPGGCSHWVLWKHKRNELPNCRDFPQQPMGCLSCDLQPRVPQSTGMGILKCLQHPSPQVHLESGYPSYKASFLSKLDASKLHPICIP